MKSYKAIFFDWDGTAVLSRRAPTDDVVKVMRPLLDKGISLIIISGTTYENIAKGELEKNFTPSQLQNLFLGLGRGAFNYRYDTNGKPFIWKNCIPKKQTILDIHTICFSLHKRLLKEYDLETDIVFSRPGYCKVDLMVGADRGENLFLQEGELEALQSHLEKHGYNKCLHGLIDECLTQGKAMNIELAVTSDAKYLEIGTATKSDNVNNIFDLLQHERNINIDDCCFWGDEYIGLANDIFGSDSFMITEKTKQAEFFDVSLASGARPKGVKVLGGGIETFHNFLKQQTETN
jgi:beta-phosphoglucomutase-like phosphatase (HAD superfamily)